MQEFVTMTSTWRNKDGKCCCIISKRDYREEFSTFRITGHNPLPCMEFKGTYHVLVEWLKDNGWVKVVSMNDYIPDTVVIRRG